MSSTGAVAADVELDAYQIVFSKRDVVANVQSATERLCLFLRRRRGSRNVLRNIFSISLELCDPARDQRAGFLIELVKTIAGVAGCLRILCVYLEVQFLVGFF